MSDVPREEESEIWITKTQEVLSEAKLLLRDIEEMLSRFSPTHPSDQRGSRMADTEKEAVVIGGFIFESAAAMEDQRRPSSQSREGR